MLTAREDALKGVLAEASSRLAAFASPSSPAYKALLADLVSQGVSKMGAVGALKVRCRQVDLAAVQEAVAKVSKAHPSVPLSVDSAAFLPPPPDPARPDAASCYGGVVVATADGTIKVSNTLEDRLRVAYDLNVPDLRIKIFGKSGGHLRT